jgi:programmed cell death 6-interacting protein
VKKCEPGDFGAGLTRLINVAYGEFAAQTHAVDVTAVRRAREYAVGAAKAAQLGLDVAHGPSPEDALLLYAAVLERTDAVLGLEARDLKVLELRWTQCWEPDDKAASVGSQYDLVVERATVFVNLAAVWSGRGAELDLTDGDSIKSAAKFFQLAAGALAAAQQLKSESIVERCPLDLTNGALNALKTLMLAQAQACFCEKAVLDGLGNSLRAKLCTGASSLYKQAADAMSALPSKALKVRAHSRARAR